MCVEVWVRKLSCVTTQYFKFREAMNRLSAGRWLDQTSGHFLCMTHTNRIKVFTLSQTLPINKFVVLLPYHRNCKKYHCHPLAPGLLAFAMSGSMGPSSPPYVPDPSGRGTVGLILSCVVTLSLCVWTAIHMNVDPSRNKWRRFLNKLVWVLLGILAPEFVLWRACSQWLSARELCKQRKFLVGNERIIASTTDM